MSVSSAFLLQLLFGSPDRTDSLRPEGDVAPATEGGELDAPKRGLRGFISNRGSGNMVDETLQAAFEIKTACDEISRKLLRWHWEQKAATVAQVPVPQAQVSPLPRSHTRIFRWVASTTSTNSVLIRSGKFGWFSKAGPISSSFRLSTSGTTVTQWGLPTPMQVTCQRLPSTSSGQSTSGPSPMFTAGRAAAMVVYSPISTCHSRAPIRVTVLQPAPVSMASRGFATPWVYSHSATQRTPLPHICASLPSALKMRIRPSAPGVTGAQMQMMPSAPTEKCRRDRSRASGTMFSGTPLSRQSR